MAPLTILKTTKIIFKSYEVEGAEHGCGGRKVGGHCRWSSARYPNVGVKQPGVTQGLEIYKEGYTEQLLASMTKSPLPKLHWGIPL